MHTLTRTHTHTIAHTCIHPPFLGVPLSSSVSQSPCVCHPFPHACLPISQPSCPRNHSFKSRCTLLKNVDYDAFLYRIVKNQHLQSTLLGWREVVTKRVLSVWTTPKHAIVLVVNIYHPLVLSASCSVTSDRLIEPLEDEVFHELVNVKLPLLVPPEETILEANGTRFGAYLRA